MSAMSRSSEVSTAGFCHWRDRPLSPSARRDIELTALIHQIHECSYDGTYGAPRIHKELRESYAVRVRRKRVAWRMRRAGLQGVQSVASAAPPVAARLSVSRRIWCNGASRPIDRMRCGLRM